MVLRDVERECLWSQQNESRLVAQSLRSLIFIIGQCPQCPLHRWEPDHLNANKGGTIFSWRRFLSIFPKQYVALSGSYGKGKAS